MNATDNREGPAFGLPAGVSRAPVEGRVFATLLDLVVPVILVVLGVVINSIGWTFVLLVLAIGYLVLTWSMIGRRAASPGLRVVKLQVVGLHDGRPIGFGRSAVRGVILLLLIFTGVGLIALAAVTLRSTRRQGPHDLVADDVVIMARPLAPSTSSRAAGPRTTEAPDREEPADDDARAGTDSAAEAVEPAEADRPDGVADGLATAEADDDHSAPEPAEDPAVNAAATSRPQQSGPPPPDQGWGGLLDDQREFRIGHLVLLGRQPGPRDGEEDAELIKVSDPARTVSKTHVAIDVDARGPYAVDRGSTNGTAVTDPNGRYTLLVAGAAHRLEVGDVVAFGDHRVEIIRTEPGEATDPGSLAGQR